MNGPDMLKRWLTGWGYTDGLSEYISQFQEAKYDGLVYRGLFFDHYPSPSEIYDQNLCSWTTNKDVAEYFASHGKYGIVLSKRSTGYDVEKILEMLRERGEIPESLKNYRKGCSEREILDSLEVQVVKMRRIGMR